MEPSSRAPPPPAQQPPPPDSPVSDGSPHKRIRLGSTARPPLPPAQQAAALDSAPDLQRREAAAALPTRQTLAPPSPSSPESPAPSAPPPPAPSAPRSTKPSPAHRLSSLLQSSPSHEVGPVDDPPPPPPPATSAPRSAKPSPPHHLSSLLQSSPSHEVGPVDDPPPPPPPPAPSAPRSAKPSPPHHLSSLLQSSPSHEVGPVDDPLPPPPAAVSIVNRAARDDAPPPTKKAAAGEDAEKGSRVVSWILHRRKRGETIARAAILARLAAVVLSLISFSVMAANRTKGWAGDSFDRYMEYRFCITVNILAFAYSGFQAYAQVHRLINDKDIIPLPMRLYFDFAMDQVLAYLLIAAAASAATRNSDWVTNWGNDPFTVMANGSISVAFLAFAALAISALISAFTLFSKIS